MSLGQLFRRCAFALVALGAASLPLHQAEAKAKAPDTIEKCAIVEPDNAAELLGKAGRKIKTCYVKEANGSEYMTVRTVSTLPNHKGYVNVRNGLNARFTVDRQQGLPVAGAQIQWSDAQYTMFLRKPVNGKTSIVSSLDMKEPQGLSDEKKKEYYINRSDKARNALNQLIDEVTAVHARDLPKAVPLTYTAEDEVQSAVKPDGTHETLFNAPAARDQIERDVEASNLKYKDYPDFTPLMYNKETDILSWIIPDPAPAKGAAKVVQTPVDPEEHAVDVIVPEKKPEDTALRADPSERFRTAAYHETTYKQAARIVGAKVASLFGRAPQALSLA